MRMLSNAGSAATSHELGGVVRGPGRAILAEVTGNAFWPQGHCDGAQIGANADTER